MNFTAAFDLHARSTPEKHAIVYNGEPWTYAEIQGYSEQFASFLTEQGVRPGDKVPLYMANTPEYVVAFFGCLRHGAVPVPINERLQTQKIDFILEDVAADVALIRPASATTLDTSELAIERVYEFGAPEGERTRSRDAIAEFLDEYEPSSGSIDRSNDEIANIMYTSGTTGNPKGVIWQHGYHHALGMGRADHFDLTQSDVFLVVSPTYHLSGHGVLSLAAFIGGTAVLLEEWDSDQFLRAIGDHDVSVVHVVSTVLIDLLEKHETLAEEHDVDSLDIVLTGGGSISSDQIRAFEETFGATICEGYGRTEGGTSFNAPDERKLGSNGLPMRGINEMKIVDIDERDEVPPGTEGEIMVRGEGVTIGYYDRPELNDEVFTDDGWMHTGDRGYIDEDGFLHFTGRLDHMIKTGGENVFPREVEETLQSIDGVAETAVVGLPHERWGEVVTAAIVREDDSLTKEQIKEYCRSSMAGFKTPREIHFLDSLPKQGSQKVDQQSVKRTLESLNES